jgi:hypothetical protein
VNIRVIVASAIIRVKELEARDIAVMRSYWLVRERGKGGKLGNSNSCRVIKVVRNVGV